MYLHDPDQNGVDFNRDRQRDQWPQNAAGDIERFIHPIDNLLKEFKQ
jgi:catechol-2,3-dioxygenase